ncbi:DNA-directed RNA polymerase III subunit RPC4 [Bombyx mori]|uniref:DNA-directed RNA polymerase III subunit RPC4 n=1 Tax=Bombyx mori TaxID=7091 RepID=A0A8R2AT07_BOMMO|nr:DNA-directed RNA polymerase III subunit RPC4 [Bombyx mori]
MSGDKSSKPNGLGTDPMQRLASLKAPRDLMLGGVKPNKKVFTPNLNVARSKNKGQATTSAKETRNEEKNSRDSNRNRNFNRNQRNGPTLIKSAGVFSEGIGSSERHSSSRSYYGRDTEKTTNIMKKPAIRVKDFVKIDKELEEKKINMILRGGDTDELESIDFKDILDRDAPIKLPMDDGNWAKTHAKPKVKVKEEIVVKTEPREDGDCVISTPERKPDVKEAFEDTDLVNLLNNDKSTLIMLQLPSSLPGRGGRVEDDVPRRRTKNEPGPSAGGGADPGAADEQEEDNKCRLTDLEEGRIGKLQLHRSGRVTLALGETVFEVSMGTKAAFHQELVSVSTDDASRSAKVTSLGALRHKLNVIPDWETMFRDIPL